VKKISDNPSLKELQTQLDGIGALMTAVGWIPFGRLIFPEFSEALKSLDSLQEQAKIFQVLDQFNDEFSSNGWIAYESMSLDSMVRALGIVREQGLSAAEEFLANTYDEDALKFGIQCCNGHPDFRKRVRLLELAKADYLAGRYHACIPLLLSLIDGLANDVSKHIGFFAEGAKLTAWDSIAAHETGLTALAKIMGLGRNKTNEDEITIPYRNGILHGRELAFDNKIVAAKCWATLFALRDWAAALASGKNKPQPKTKITWGEVRKQVVKAEQLKQAMDNWQPRIGAELNHLPSVGPASLLPEGTPERVLSEFLDSWCGRRYGPMAEVLVDYLDRPLGKKAGLAKNDFGRHTPSGYKLLSVTDKSAAMSKVEIELSIAEGGTKELVYLSIGIEFQNAQNDLAIWKHDPGSWKILQGGFGDLIYRA
jgi:hypothetical protein